MIPVEIYRAMPYVLAFLLALAIPVGATLQYRLTRRASPELRINTLIAVIAAGALLTVALTPRMLNERELETAGRQLMADFDDGFSASRYLNMFVVGAAFVEMLRGWIDSRAAPVADPARPILVGLLAFYFCTILVQALGSAHPDFSYKSLYVPIVLLAVYYQRVTNVESVLQVAKLAIFALMALSLAGMLIKPDFVIHRPDKGLIPGVDFRLFGLTPHANALGPVALIGLILELHSPSTLRAMRVAHLLAAAAVFVLAQSKTAWVAALIVVVLVAVPAGFIPNLEPSRRQKNFGRAVFMTLACIGLLIVVSVGLVAFDVFGYVEQNAQVETLSGRKQIWDITLQAWHESLLFGYGREIWGAERMLKFRLFHVGQAHNQFIQTLGEAGLMGLVLLLVYLLTLLQACLRQFVASRGITLALLIVVLARCVTEAPLRLDGILSWPIFTLVLLLVLVCHFQRAQRLAAKSTEVRRPAGALRPGPGPFGAETLDRHDRGVG